MPKLEFFQIEPQTNDEYPKRAIVEQYGLGWLWRNFFTNQAYDAFSTFVGECDKLVRTFALLRQNGTPRDN